MKRSHRHIFLALFGLTSAVALVVFSAPYLTARGFPLDDSWIHAVYGRSVAQQALLAYNPGQPAAGETAPAWALVWAVPHLLASNTATIVAAIKGIGFALHLVAVALLYFALEEEASGPLADAALLVGAGCVAMHPDLVAAGVSGMEISAATTVVSLMAFGTFRHRPGALAAGALLAPLVRPEIALFAFLLPVLYDWNRWSRLRTHLLASTAGTLVGWGAIAAYHLSTWGRPLPATFYAKAGAAGWSIPRSVWQGLHELLYQFPVADASLVLVVLVPVAGAYLWRADAPPLGRSAASLYTSSLVFALVSFVLVPPVDPDAFYHQRFVLPALPTLVVAVPILAGESTRRLAGPETGAWVLAGVTLVAAAAIGVETPDRHRRLENDAHNIDDVQVALGKQLADVPDEHVVWVTDAGAIRYFAAGHVVDLVGLNSSALLTDGAEDYLETHPPDAFEYVPGWMGLPESAFESFPKREFAATTRYTVTSNQQMRRQFLIRCEPPGAGGQLRVQQRPLEFRCAE